MTPYIGMKVILNGGMNAATKRSPTEGFCTGLKMVAFVTHILKNGDVSLIVFPPGSRGEFYAPVAVKQGSVDELGTWHPVPEECPDQLDPAGRSGWIDRYDWARQSEPFPDRGAIGLTDQHGEPVTETDKARQLRESGDRRDWNECDRLEGVNTPTPDTGD